MTINDSALEWIAVGAESVVIGRSREATARLPISTVSRKHATLNRRGDAIAIEDHDSKYGTFVNGNRIRKLVARPGDYIRFGTLMTYRIEAGGLRREKTTQGMSIAVEGLAISRGGKRIVDGIDFQIVPDAFVGILGPSGAGKSTILNAVATYLLPGKGRIVFDQDRDVTEHQAEFRAAMGHVPQDNTIFEALTVPENLAFAARLRLVAAQESESHLNVEVNRIVELVGLAGHAGKQAEKLSGGQKKRLSVAIELLRKPRLLLLDEPTSGLDPGSGARLMEHLRKISRQGTTVVCTTHLMDNIHLFDAVVVLGVLDGSGRIAYCGPPDGLLNDFNCTNFADLYDKLEKGRFAALDDRNTEIGSSNVQTPATASMGNPALQSAPKPGTSSLSVVPSTRITIPQLVNPSHTADIVSQCANLCERAGLLIWRDRNLLWAMLAQPLVLGLLVCLTQYAASHITSLLFFSIVVAIWMGLNNSVRELVRERKLYIRDRLAGLQPVAYLASKLLVHTVVGAAQLLLLLFIVRVFGALLLDEPRADDLRNVSLIWLFCVLMACYTGALGLGLLVSVLVNSEAAAVAFLPLLIMPQLLLSAVGTSQIEDVYHRPHEVRPFRPLVVKLQSETSLPASAACVDFLSLGLFSRPAILLAEQPTVPRKFGGWFWIADLCHLVVLVLATWTVAFLAFQWAEQRWTRLIGIG